MSAFASNRFVWLFDRAISLLVRAAACVAPVFVLVQQDLGAVLPVAVMLGLVDGWFRLWSWRSACSFTPIAQGLRIDAQVVSWNELLAIQHWRLINDIDCVAVHYRTDAGSTVASSSVRGRSAELAAFLRACAAHARHDVITLATLRDRPVALALLRRWLVDVAVALALGAVLGVLGAAAICSFAGATASASLVGFRYGVRPLTLRLKDGVWCKDGAEPQRLRVIPGSLRAWVSALTR